MKEIQSGGKKNDQKNELRRAAGRPTGHEERA